MQNYEEDPDNNNEQIKEHAIEGLRWALAPVEKDELLGWEDVNDRFELVGQNLIDLFDLNEKPEHKISEFFKITYRKVHILGPIVEIYRCHPEKQHHYLVRVPVSEGGTYFSINIPDGESGTFALTRGMEDSDAGPQAWGFTLALQLAVKEIFEEINGEPLNVDEEALSLPAPQEVVLRERAIEGLQRILKIPPENRYANYGEMAIDLYHFGEDLASLVGRRGTTAIYESQKGVNIRVDFSADGILKLEVNSAGIRQYELIIAADEKSLMTPTSMSVISAMDARNGIPKFHFPGLTPGIPMEQQAFFSVAQEAARDILIAFNAELPPFNNPPDDPFTDFINSIK